MVASLGEILQDDWKSEFFSCGGVAWTPPLDHDLRVPHNYQPEDGQCDNHEQDRKYLVVEAPLGIHAAQSDDETGHEHEPAGFGYPAPEPLRKAFAPTVERVEKGSKPGAPPVLNYPNSRK